MSDEQTMGKNPALDVIKEQELFEKIEIPSKNGGQAIELNIFTPAKDDDLLKESKAAMAILKKKKEQEQEGLQDTSLKNDIDDNYNT